MEHQQQQPSSAQKDFQDAYEKEHYKAVYLANRVAQLEDQVDDLQFKLDRIKNNPVWKASAPARKCMHFVIRQKDRLKKLRKPLGRDPEDALQGVGKKRR
ncbi:MAG: hypothetical protein ACLTQL_00545 [Eisenbergiella sp.]